MHTKPQYIAFGQGLVALPQPLENLSGQVTEILALKILRGEFHSDEPLPTEKELQLSLGVSRTTLREAVKKLTSKGLLLVGPSKGTRVRPAVEWNVLDPDLLRWRLKLGVTPKLIQDMYELRECFEPPASRLTAERASETDLASIQRAFEALKASRESGGYESVVADVNFHTTIIRCTKNELLSSFANVIESTLEASFIVARNRVELSFEDVQLHEVIVKAIMKRDGRAAQRATERMLEQSKAVQMEAANAAPRTRASSRTATTAR